MGAGQFHNLSTETAEEDNLLGAAGFGETWPLYLRSRPQGSDEN